MCFRIYKKDKRKPKYLIAKKDIKVYKIVRSLYEYDKKNIKDLNKNPDNFCKPEYSNTENFFYEKDIPAPIEKINLITNSYVSILWEGNIGYHSYRKKSDAKYNLFSHFLSIAEFIIPKGTKYYTNNTEYYSETIIFKNYL